MTTNSTPPGNGSGAAPFKCRKRTALTAKEHAYVLDCIQRSGHAPQENLCFENSQRILADGDEDELLTYWEGRVQSARPLWVHHGWLTINDKIVDVTLCSSDFGVKLRARPGATKDDDFRRLDDRVYLGEPIDDDEVMMRAAARVWENVLEQHDALTRCAEECP